MTAKEFETIFRKTYTPLGMYALRIVGDADTAEDMVQNVFIKIWQAVVSGKETGCSVSYLYLAVRNECISWLRRHKDTADIDTIPDVDEDVIDTSERDARIWKAIDALPEKCRCVFLMSKRDGLSNEEIAEEMGISVKTVKNQLTKALSRLREALEPNRRPFFLPFL